jgi:hypothetical protein
MAITNPTAESVRQRLIDGLFPPVARVVLAVDEIKAAWDVRDLDRMGRAVRLADRRVAEYIEQVQA